MSSLDSEPHFAPEAQEVFTPGDRIYAIEDDMYVKAGSEGVYVGRFHNTPIVGWDTPSGEPFRAQSHFATIRQLYR